MMGSARAQYYLGLMYDQGRGVPQGHLQEQIWMNLAAAIRLDEAPLIIKVMPAADISVAQRLAREWLEAHGE